MCKIWTKSEGVGFRDLLTWRGMTREQEKYAEWYPTITINKNFLLKNTEKPASKLQNDILYGIPYDIPYGIPYDRNKTF